MKYFLIILLFSSVTLGQEAQFTPKNPQEILRLKNTFDLKNDTILSYLLLEDDRTLLIVGKKTTQIWDVEAKKMLSEIPHEISNNHKTFWGTKISPDGNYLLIFDNVYSEQFPVLVKSKKNAAAIYDLRTGKLSAVLEGGMNSLNYAFWSENGKTIVTDTELNARTQEQEFCFLDGETLKYRNCFSVFGYVWWFKLSKDGTKFFASVSKETQNMGVNLGTQNWVGIWDTKKVKLLKRFNLDEQTRYENDFFLSQDESFLIGGETIFEVDGSTLPKFKVGSRIRGVSENGNYFMASEKNGLQFYDFKNNQKKYLIPGIKDARQINFLTNDKILISQNIARRCGRTEGFEIETGKKLWEIKLACRWESSDCFFCSDKLNFNDSIDFLNDGKFFLTSSEKAVRVWNTMTGELVQALINPNHQIEKAINPKVDDKIRGEKKNWSKDKKFVYFQDADDTKIFQYELSIR